MIKLQGWKGFGRLSVLATYDFKGFTSFHSMVNFTSIHNKSLFSLLLQGIKRGWLESREIGTYQAENSHFSDLFLSLSLMNFLNLAIFSLVQ